MPFDKEETRYMAFAMVFCMRTAAAAAASTEYTWNALLSAR